MLSTTATLLDLLGTHANQSGIWQDGNRVSYSEVCSLAFRLAESLSNHGTGRVAIGSPRADSVTVAILACQLADRELVLLRGNIPPESSLLSAHGVSTLIGQELNVLSVAADITEVRGFHLLIGTSGTTGTPKIARHSLEAILGRISQRPNHCAPARWLLAFSPASFAGLTFPNVDTARIITVNLLGAIRMARLMLQALLVSNRKGRIINISSIIGSRGYTGLAAYSASKSGIDGLTCSLAREVGRRDITVNSVAPGYLATDMSHTLSADQRLQIIRRTPLNRLGRTYDIVPLLRFLLSDGASFITGQTLIVDGGATC